MGFLAQESSLAEGAAVSSPRGFDCQCRPEWMGDLHPVLASQGFHLGEITGKR